MTKDTDREAVLGCLLGQAVGDAMGLPMEGLSRRRGPRLYPHVHRMQFFFGRGMSSDDTDHACMTAGALQSLRTLGEIIDVECSHSHKFREWLADHLRWWFLGLPAGIGKATLKACLKLWLGWPSTKSGVFSAGNGPAMRAGIIGAALSRCDDLLPRFVRESTRITHTDPKAEYGALAVALAAKLAATTRNEPAPTAETFGKMLDAALPHDQPADELRGLVRKVVDGLAGGLTVEAFAERLGLARSVSGYMYHTVPVALFAFFRHPDDYRAAVQGVIRCGGDTDTVAAIAGALVGTRVGKAGIPAEWLAGYRDWPWSVRRIERLVGRLFGEDVPSGQGFRRSAMGAFTRDLFNAICYPPQRVARNLFFFAVVLGHVVRRMLPPY